jgi:hypothetical protein
VFSLAYLAQHCASIAPVAYDVSYSVAYDVVMLLLMLLLMLSCSALHPKIIVRQFRNEIPFILVINEKVYF